MHVSTPNIRPIKHAHIFCGIGGGARGFNQAAPRLGNLQAYFRCLGGIDVDAAAIRDFSRLAGGPGTCLNLTPLARPRGIDPPVVARQS
jgi:hypothetical protein